MNLEILEAAKFEFVSASRGGADSEGIASGSIGRSSLRTIVAPLFVADDVSGCSDTHTLSADPVELVREVVALRLDSLEKGFLE